MATFTFTNTDENGDLSDANNWSGDELPSETAGDTAIIDSDQLGPVLNVSVSAQFETIGDASAGQFAQSSQFDLSINRVAGTLTLGNQQGSAGTYDITGGTLSVGGAMIVGLSGHGEVDQGGGTTYVDNGGSNNGVLLGLNEGGSGIYHLHDSGRLSANLLVVGRGGQGEFDILNGSAASIAGDVKLGVLTNADGLKANGSLEVVGPDSTLHVGGALNSGIDGSGHFSVQSGGSISAAAWP